MGSKVPTIRFVFRFLTPYHPKNPAIWVQDVREHYRRSPGSPQGEFFERARDGIVAGQGIRLSCWAGHFSPTWCMRGGPQLAASGVVTQQSAKVFAGRKAIECKGVVEPLSPTRS